MCQLWAGERVSLCPSLIPPRNQPTYFSPLAFFNIAAAADANVLLLSLPLQQPQGQGHHLLRDRGEVEVEGHDRRWHSRHWDNVYPES